MADELADDELARWVAQVRADGEELLPLDLRALRQPRPRTPGPPVALVIEVEVPVTPSVSARWYRPHNEALPAVVFVHGGGFVAGGLESHDRTCRRLAIEAETGVLAVDCRLAPEHPAPAAVDDVVSIAMWLSDHPAELGSLVGRPALAGDSSGGTIALLAAGRLAALGAPASAVLVVCPLSDLTLAQPSVREKGTGWGLSATGLAWSVAQWVPTLDARSLRCYSPLHADLVGLPATLVATAEHDPLRDGGAALVDRLIGYGVDAQHLAHPGLVHGFLGLDDVSPAAFEAGTRLMRRFGELLQRQ